MKRILIFLFIFKAPDTVLAKLAAKINPFQKNIQECLQDQIDAKALGSLQKLYAFVADKYVLISSEVVAREVEYKIKDQKRKLSYENGKVQLYKILEDDGDSVIPINNEVRQKSLTIESYLEQLLLSADIRSDWSKVSETRAGATAVVITRVDGEVKTLQIERAKIKKKLDCARSETGESCACSTTQ